MIKKRIFIVGTARSGTTLLQSLIGGHPEVFTLPETHFFDYSFHKQKWLRSLKGVREKGIQNAREVLTAQGHPELAELTKGSFNNASWSVVLINLLDRLCEKNNKQIWLEKTPFHLYYLDLIAEATSELRVVHVLRDPVGNIASLMDAGQKHQETFHQPDLEKAMARWIDEFKMHAEYQNLENHCFVSYDSIVEAPERNMRRVLEFLNLEFVPETLNPTGIADGIVEEKESWKSKNRESISASDKADRVLTQEQRDYIRRKTAKYALARFPGLGD